MTLVLACLTCFHKLFVFKIETTGSSIRLCGNVFRQSCLHCTAVKAPTSLLSFGALLSFFKSENGALLMFGKNDLEMKRWHQLLFVSKQNEKRVQALANFVNAI